MKTTIEIDARILNAMACLVGRDQSRHVLTGIKLEFGKEDIKLIATDGRLMGIYRIESKQEQVGDIVLPVDWLWMFKLDSRRSSMMTLQIDEQDFKVTFKSRNISGRLIEGSYPTWRQCIPTGPIQSPKEFCFSANLASRFQRAFQILKPGSAASFKIKAHSNNEIGPFSILGQDPNFYGLLMPLRDSMEDIPDWVKQ